MLTPAGILVWISAILDQRTVALVTSTGQRRGRENCNDETGLDCTGSHAGDHDRELTKGARERSTVDFLATGNSHKRLNERKIYCLYVPGAQELGIPYHEMGRKWTARGLNDTRF